MAHFNDADTNRPSTSTSGWSTPRRGRTPVSEYASIDTPKTPTNGRSVYMEWDRTSSPSPGESPRASNSNDVRTQGEGRISPSKRFWDVIGPCTKSNSSNIPSLENPPDSPAVSEVSTVTPAQKSHKCVPSTRRLVWNTPIVQQSTSPRKVTTPQKSRYIPYEVPVTYVHSNKGANAEAGPSNVTSPRTPSVTMSPTTPPGGLSEASASAEQTNQLTEENAAPPAQDIAPTPRKCKWRVKYTESLRKLVNWAGQYKGFTSRPSQEEALTIALEVVRMHHPTPVYAESRLKKGGPPKAQSAKNQRESAVIECKRREDTRRINEELSRYYELPHGWAEWTCSDLIVEVCRDIERLDGRCCAICGKNIALSS